MSSIDEKKEFMLEALERLNSVAPSETAGPAPIFFIFVIHAVSNSLDKKMGIQDP
jgi:hypothetical protein